MDCETRIAALERRCRLLMGCLFACMLLSMTVLLMGAVEVKKPTDQVARSLTLVDDQGNPRARLFTKDDKVSFALTRADGGVGAWLQVTDAESVLNVHPPMEADKTGVVLYSSHQHRGIGITDPDGEVIWHTPE